MLDHEHGRAQLAPDLEQERPERLGLPLGDAGGGLVEAQHPGVGGEEARQLHDAAHAGGELVDEALRRSGPRPEEVEDLVGVGLLGPLDPPGLRAGPSATVAKRARARASSRDLDGLPHREVAEQRGVLEGAAEAQAALGGLALMPCTSCPSTWTRPGAGDDSRRRRS